MVTCLRILLARWFGPARTEESVALRRENAIPEFLLARANTLLPYDENLLEQARNQWQLGDWDSLVMLDRETLQHHPDRAELALLAAAGHLQKNRIDAARGLVRNAVDWGCPRKIVGSILISDAYNALARIAAAGHQPSKSLTYLNKAVAVSTSARATRQLEPFLRPAIIQSIERISERIKSQQSILMNQVRGETSDLIALEQSVVSTLKKELFNATKQVEAFIALQTYFKAGELIPEMHGWPISPDFALFLVHLLEANDYDLIIEFGSGTSTMLIAKTLNNLTYGRKRDSPARQFAFEHLQKYYDQTLASLTQAGCQDAVHLFFSPLMPYTAPNGNSYPYYDCQEVISDIAAASDSNPSKILVVVDGPPGATARHARYPAVPVMLKYFSDSTIDFLLDDYVRDEEKEIAVLWQSELKAVNIMYKFYEHKFEKGACLLSLETNRNNKS